MARSQVMVQLTDELVELLDREARRRSMSRSAVIRTAVEEHLAASREQRISALLLAGYERIPPATPDKWGSVEELADVAAGELMQRLDAEEQEAGLEPW